MNLIYVQIKKKKLVTGDAVEEEELDDMQEVRGSNPCKSGQMRQIFISTPHTIAIMNYYVLLCSSRTIVYKICVKNYNFLPLISHNFLNLCQPGYEFLKHEIATI